MLTDPPYGAEYEGKTRERLRIRNDDAAAIAELLPAAFAVADGHLAAGGAAYIFSPSGSGLGVFVDAFSGVGWELRQSLVWVKDQMVLGHADYHLQHELVLYGYKPTPRRGQAGPWRRQVGVVGMGRCRCLRCRGRGRLGCIRR